MSTEAKSSGSAKSWLRAVVLGASVYVLMEACLLAVAGHLDRCWLYWNLFYWRRLVDYPYLPFLWIGLILIFAPEFRRRGLYAFTAVALFLFWPWQEFGFSRLAAAEPSAMGRLRELRAALVDRQRAEGSNPATLPDVPTNSWVEPYYDFEYQPVRSSGAVTDYVLRATPKARSRMCGCTLSFVVAKDGVFHYTHEARPATLQDQLLE
jgi:hypothetical protein